jgi:NADP-dependent 3-hydroxy acid dehydrogenase YdfG
MINKIYKSVLITGASSGIGLETLKRFLKENVKVYALDKDVSILEKLKKNSLK